MKPPLKPPMTPRALPVLETARLEVRLARAEDLPEILAYYVRNREFLRPTAPERVPDFFTAPFWVLQIDAMIRDFYADLSVRFFLFEKSRVVGTTHLSNLVRGA